MILDIFNFLLDVVASFFGYLLLLRFALQWRRISFLNPLGPFVLQATNWAVLPLRKVLPAVGGLDMASLVPAWLMQVLVKLVLLSLKGGAALGVGALLPVALVMGFFELLHMAVMAVIALLLAQAVLSWVNPHAPMAGPIRALVEPLLRPLRRIVPPIAHVDLSPLVAIVLAQVLMMLLTYAKAALMPLLF